MAHWAETSPRPLDGVESAGRQAGQISRARSYGQCAEPFLDGMTRVGDAYRVCGLLGNVMLDVVRPPASTTLFTRVHIPLVLSVMPFAIIHETVATLRPRGADCVSNRVRQPQYWAFGKLPVGPAECTELVMAMKIAQVALLGAGTQGPTCLLFGVRFECNQVETGTRLVERIVMIQRRGPYR